MRIRKSYRVPLAAPLAAITLPFFAGEAGAQAAAPDAPDPDTIVARIEARQAPERGGLDAYTIEELLERFNVPGLSVAVIHDFDVHWTREYGVVDVESGRPVDASTMFQAASISKPITAMAVMRLAQEGRLSPDADVNRYLTSWTVPAIGTRPVTLRALLSHTAGADDGFGFPGYPPGSPLPTLVQILNGEPPSNVGPVEFVRPPYEAQKYSGGSTTIVQLTIEDVTGRPFAEVMRELLLDPLALGNSTFAQPFPERYHQRAASAHSGSGETLPARWHEYPEQAAAGLWTTPTDLARLMIEVQRALRGDGPGGRVLTTESARELTSPVGVGPFAVGFDVAREGEGWYFSHGGSNYGFRGLARAHVRNGYGVVVLANAPGGWQVAQEIAARVAAAYNWDSLHRPLLR